MKINQTNMNLFFYFIRHLSLFLLILPKPVLAEIIGKTSFETKCQRKIERKWSKESCNGLDHQLQSSEKLSYAFNLIKSKVADGQWAARLGTTRMHIAPKQSVVDENCRVHGVSNLFIAGSSVFPTGGHANSTLTIIALAIRLADHVKLLKFKLLPCAS